MSAPALRAVRAALRDAGRVDLSWLDPVPTWDGWALAPDTLRFLTSLVARLKPRHVIEFGSGVSTAVLLRALASTRRSCALSSIDHDPEFGRVDRKHLRRWSTRCALRTQIVPLVARNFGGKLLPSYLIDEAKLASSAPADLVLIDGPPASLGGREGVLYQILHRTKRGALVLLDDAARPQEQAALANWATNLGDAIEIEVCRSLKKGLGCILIRDTVPSAALWRHRVTLTNRELSRELPRRAPVIVVDQYEWAGHLTLTQPVLTFRGAPANDQGAIRELVALRARGAQYLVLGWPAFWWVDAYPRFYTYLCARYTPLVRNDRVMVFDLRGPRA
jgi:predicted O-methyltransferase YrrM